MTNPILEAALAWHAAGASVVPTKNDGSKAPFSYWTEYQTTRATEEQIRTWFTNGQYDGFGAICGTVSGGMEMYELEGRAAHLLPELVTAMEDNGLGDLWRRVSSGYLETTPSGGYHWLYRVHGGDVPGNLKLARRPSTEQEFDEHIARLRADAEQEPREDVRARRLATIDRLTPERVPQVLIETRGEGGFTVLAPSGGRTHPTGQAWTTLIGSPASLPTITLEEREALHAVAAMFDQMPEEVAPAALEPTRRTGSAAGQDDTSDGAVRPGDDYNTKATWDDILTPHGWTRAHRLGNGYGWTRPGKNPRDGISATTGQAGDADRLYVFTTSTVFEEGRPYSKFAAYALLEHGGDYANAARELARQGYGTRARETTLRVVSNDLDGLIPPNQQTPPARPAPAVPPTNGATALQPHRTPPPPPATITEHRMTLTDVGNAHLLVAKHAHHIRYVARRGEWLIWDGARWAPDDTGHVHELAKQTILDIDPDSSDAAAKHRTRSLSRRAIEAMVALTRTDPNVAVLPQQLDAHPYHLCTPGGVVNLRTGQLDPADPADLHTRITTAAPNPQHPTPRWDRFLEQTFQGQTDMVDFVQRLAGYSALGIVTRHVLPFLIGPGGNGKSVFLDVLRAILGDYAATTPAKFLMAGLNQHETEVARLSGLRLVISSEVNEEDRFDEAKVKLLTGGDALTARFMHQNHFTFDPTHTLWLMGNHQPKVSAGGASFWRRLRLIDFKNTVAEKDRVEGLDKLLVEEEGPGILAWIVKGAVAFLHDGLREPDAVMAATNLYASEEDHLARFVEDRINLGGGKLVRENTANVRHAYEQWCRDQGEKPTSPQAFGRELRTRYGIEQVRSHGARYYTGLTLLSDESEPDQQAEWWDK